ncbi:MAG: MFS transporter [Bilophila sp.]
MDEPLSSSHSERPASYLGLLYIALCTMAILYAPQPLLNAIRTEFAVSDATTGLLISIALLPLAVAPLFYGPLLSRIPTRTVLIVAICLLGISGALIYLAPSFSVLLAVRFLQGLLPPAIFTAIMAHISNKFQGSELQRALALYIGATILGGVAGRILAGLLASLWGWRISLLLLALSIAPGLPSLFRLRSEARAHAPLPKLSEFAAVLREPGVAGLMLVEGCTFFVFVGIGNLIPFRMEDIGAGHSEFRIGLMYSGYALGVATALCSRRLIALLGGETRLLLAGIAVYALAFGGFLFPSVEALFVTMLLICLGQFAEHTTAPGLINRLASEDKGVVNGLYLAFYYGGGVLGSYLSALFYDAFGWHVCLLCLFALVCMALLLGLRLHYTIPRLLR